MSSTNEKIKRRVVPLAAVVDTQDGSSVGLCGQVQPIDLVTSVFSFLEYIGLAPVIRSPCHFNAETWSKYIVFMTAILKSKMAAQWELWARVKLIDLDTNVLWALQKISLAFKLKLEVIQRPRYGLDLLHTKLSYAMDLLSFKSFCICRPTIPFPSRPCPPSGCFRELCFPSGEFLQRPAET